MSEADGGGGPLLDTAPCGWVSFADDGTVRICNQTLLALLGRTKHEVVGRHVEALFTVGTRIFYQTHLFPLLRLHGHAEEIFLLLRAADGSDVAVLTNARRHEREGEWVTDCVMLRIVERRKFEDALLRAKRDAEEARSVAEVSRHQLVDARMAAEHANRAKSEFLATMSHELRTPLNAIAGYIELLDLGVYGPVTDQQRVALQRVQRSQRHLLRLINDVLNLSRIEAGRLEYRLEPVPLCEIVEAVLPMIEPQLSERALTLSIEVPGDLVAQMDREKAEQVLLNLLSNAGKFTPPGGQVRVEGVRQPEGGNRLALRVADTGSGIPRDRLSDVFEPFVQVDTSHASRKDGTGLGLAISRDLARGMGGDLTVESEEGRGCTFTLALPQAG